MMLGRCLLVIAIILMLFVGMGDLLGNQAYAASSDMNEMMEKKGIGGLFAGKDKKDERTPSATQKWVGIGSIVVMIIVVKYL